MVATLLANIISLQYISCRNTVPFHNGRSFVNIRKRYKLTNAVVRIHKPYKIENLYKCKHKIKYVNSNVLTSPGLSTGIRKSAISEGGKYWDEIAVNIHIISNRKWDEILGSRWGRFPLGKLISASADYLEWLANITTGGEGRRGKGYFMENRRLY